MEEDCHHEESDSRPKPFPKTALSRRKFLRGTAAMVGTVAALTRSSESGIATAKRAAVAGACQLNGANGADFDATPNGGVISPGSFKTPGHPPRSAYRSLAETERKYRHLLARNSDKAQGRPKPKFSRVVNAVEDLGADPTGKKPANEALKKGARDGTLIVLPKDATFLIDGILNFDVEGTFGIVGEGYETAKHPPKKGPRFIGATNTQSRIVPGAVTSGLFANFILDQSKTNAGMTILLEAKQFCYGRDIRLVGVQDHTGTIQMDAENNPACALIARNKNASVRVQRFFAAANNIPSTKNIGAVSTFWVGKSNVGLVEIVQCQSEDGSNGIYGSRTPGNLHIIDGAYVNNAVSQIRFAGKGSWAKGCTVMVDVNTYKGPKPSEFDTKITANGVKTEMPGFLNEKGGGVLENTEVIGRAARHIGSLIFIRGHSGALTVKNCRVINQLNDVPSLLAEVPGSTYDPKTRPPWNVSVDHCTFEGKPNDSPVIDIEGRPGSSVTNTCIKIEGASSSDISGEISMKNITYGPNCKSTGASGAIGSAVNAAQSVYQGATSFVGGQVRRFFYGAAAIATVPFVVLIIVGIVALIFSSSLIAALAFAGGAIKLFSKKR